MSNIDHKVYLMTDLLGVKNAKQMRQIIKRKSRNGNRLHKAIAEELKISEQYLSDILNGRRYHTKQCVGLVATSQQQ